MNILLVCGGCDFNDKDFIWRYLDLYYSSKLDALIEGDCRGVDRICGTWARYRGIHDIKVPALWDYYGKSAGFKRNNIMAELKPYRCVAFPGGNGTENMVRLCKLKDIEVVKVQYTKGENI